MFPWLKYRYFKCDNFHIYGNLLDTNVRQSFIKNSFEDDILIDKMSFFLQQGGVYFDIGANYGFHSFSLFARLHMSSSPVFFHLFEPNRDCQKCLNKTLQRKKFKRIILYQTALDKENGESTFHCNDSNTVTGSLNRTLVSEFNTNESGIRSNYNTSRVTLDHWFIKSDIKSVTVMKIDTSGYDWNIYCGGQKTFESGLVKVIFFDLLKKQLLLHDTKVSQIVEFLLNNEYNLYYSIGQKEGKKHIFNIGNQNQSFYPMNIKRMLAKENCVNSYKHVHGMAVHSSYLNNIKITKDV